jgi:hypothetical protein
MNTLRITLMATLLAASSAYAQDGLNSSARIGTGHPASNPREATLSTGKPGAPHWSAAIGTGRASTVVVRSTSEQAVPAASAAGEARAHWTSRIGTGRASETSASAAASAPIVSRAR